MIRNQISATELGTSDRVRSGPRERGGNRMEGSLRRRRLPHEQLHEVGAVGRHAREALLGPRAALCDRGGGQGGNNIHI